MPHTYRPSSAQLDPSRTHTLRRRAEQTFRARLKRVERDIQKLLVEEDAFGLKEPNYTVFNQSYGAIMLAINDQRIKNQILAMQLQLDPSDVLEYELEPHITARYGLLPEVNLEQVSLLAAQHRVIPAQVLGVGLFSNKDVDVLKLGIQSQQLHTLHHHLSLLPNVETYRDFKPHLTIAYLKPGTGAKYLFNLANPLYGKHLTLEDVIWSDANRTHEHLTLNTRWRFLSTNDQLLRFQTWLQNTLSIHVLDAAKQEQDKYWQAYVEQGYEKGAGRAFSDTRKAAKYDGKLEFYEGTKQEFLRSAFARPEAINKVKLLASRVFTELRGLTESLATRLSRTLTDGLVQGQNPRTIAKTISADIGVGARRAETIARTEIIRAHAEGAIDSLEQLGVQEIGVAVEWSTAQDNRVCPLCQPLQGVILSVKEARGMFPRHPNCRCTPVPANLGESTKGQVRGQASIRAAIRESISRERPKRGKRTIAQQAKLSRWAGADTRLSRNRPKQLPGLTRDDKE